MPRCALTVYDATHAIANGTAAAAPNSSTPMTVQAIGVFVAPANTATKPTAANSGTGPSRPRPRVTRRVAPMTNRGVTSPPWNPDPSVTAVNSSLRANAAAATPVPPASDLVIRGIDRPR